MAKNQKPTKQVAPAQTSAAPKAKVDYKSGKKTVKFPKSFKIQAGYIAKKEDRDLYRRTMLTVLR